MDIGGLRKEQDVCDAEYFQDADIDIAPNEERNRWDLLHRIKSRENTILLGKRPIRFENSDAGKLFSRN